MNAMRISWPYAVNWRYEDGYGYGTSSHVILPGFTSVGGGGGGACCAVAPPETATIVITVQHRANQLITHLRWN
jgi:hypothetical protein